MRVFDVKLLTRVDIKKFSFHLPLARDNNNLCENCNQTLDPKKTWVLGLDLGPGPRPKPKSKTQRDPDSKFNSIHFGIETKKINKFSGLKNFETS